MVGNSFLNVVHNTKLAVQGLDALKLESETLKRKLESDINEAENHDVAAEKVCIVDGMLQAMQLELDEAQMIISIASHLQNSDAQLLKYRDKLRRLTEENRWLHEELAQTHGLLSKSEQNVAQLEQENEHLKFLNSLKQMDFVTGQVPNEYLEDGRNSLYSFNMTLPTTARCDNIEADDASSVTINLALRNATFSASTPPVKTHIQSSSSVRNDSQASTTEKVVAREDEAERRRLQRELGFGSDDDEQHQELPEDAKSVAGPHNPMSSNEDNCCSALAGISQPPADKRLKSLHALVKNITAEGRFDVAIPMCERALKDLRKQHGASHPDVATVLHTLAMAFGGEKKFENAADCMLEALQIREHAFGVDHIDVGTTLNNLAVFYEKLQRFKDAESLCKRALTIREKHFGADSQVVAKQLSNLALVHYEQRNYADAENCYRKCLRILEKLGAEDAEVTRTKIKLATALSKLRNYEESETIYKEVLTRSQRRCLVQRRKNFAKMSSREQEAIIGKSIWEVAEECEAQKLQSTDQSITALDKSLLDSIEVENADTMTALRNLGIIYREKGKYQAAETLEDAILRVTRKRSGQNISKPVQKPRQTTKNETAQNKVRKLSRRN